MISGQLDNAAVIEIIIVNCVVEIINCEDNQLNVWYCEF